MVYVVVEYGYDKYEGTWHKNVRFATTSFSKAREVSERLAKELAYLRGRVAYNPSEFYDYFDGEVDFIRIQEFNEEDVP
jgi:hypothetical protein